MKLLIKGRNKTYMICKIIYIYIHKIIHVPQSVDGMVLQDGTFSHLDLLIQKSMCYKHKKTTSRVLKKVLHHRDYKKKPAFLPVSKDFESKWNAILYEAENIIKLLMYESNQVIAKIEVEIQEEIKQEDLNRFRKKINQFENKHANFRKVIEKRRSKKW